MNDVTNPPAPPPAVNDPAARAPDGTLLNQTQSPLTTITSPETTEKPADGTVDPAAAKSAASTEPKLADKPATDTGAPEKYEPFTAPDGYVLDPAVAGEASTLFKELNLPQGSAQRLVDFYNKNVIAAAKAPAEAVETMRQGWRDQVAADKEIGGKMTEVKATIGRAYDALNDPALVTEFKAAMDLTGAGDHPAFIKAFYKIAKGFAEGQHVSGAGPSPHGQARNGNATAPTPAQAMYPSLPSSNS